LAASLGLTVRDYFGRYAADPNTDFLFQAAATELAREANRVAGHGWTGGWAVGPGADSPGRVYVDRRLWDNFPSLWFLAPVSDRLHVIDADQPVSIAPGEPAGVFVWPYENVRPVLGSIPSETAITLVAGPLARGDLEPAPYSLYSEYRLRPLGPALLEVWTPWAGFEAGLRLHGRATLQGNTVTVALAWMAGEAPDGDYQVFVHALAGEEIVAQADGPLGLGLYPSSWWRAGQVVEEARRLELPAGVRPGDVTLRVGLYDPATEVRLRRTDAPGDSFEMALEEQPSR
jgi:hypothetical protein